MFIKLKKQASFIKSAIFKAGSYRKLSIILDIPRSSLLAYSQGRLIPSKRFNRIVKYLEIDKTKLNFLEFEDNWGQIKGGKNCVKSKKDKGIFEKQLKSAQKKGVIGIKKWHNYMKKKNPREYYLIQYSKFKKIGVYKFKTKKGEKVRNNFEKEIADILSKFKVTYEYEPLVKIGNRYFFPDFLINKKIILECTMWKGETKAYQLKDKLKYLSKKYQVFVIIPKDLYRYYKILDKHLIKGLDEFVPVAQTFLV